MFGAPAFQAVTEDELQELVAAIPCRGGGGLTRSANVYLATISAQHIVDQLALAGELVVRRTNGCREQLTL